MGNVAPDVAKNTRMKNIGQWESQARIQGGGSWPPPLLSTTNFFFQQTF